MNPAALAIVGSAVVTLADWPNLSVRPYIGVVAAAALIGIVGIGNEPLGQAFSYLWLAGLILVRGGPAFDRLAAFGNK